MRVFARSSANAIAVNSKSHMSIGLEKSFFYIARNAFPVTMQAVLNARNGERGDTDRPQIP